MIASESVVERALQAAEADEVAGQMIICFGTEAVKAALAVLLEHLLSQAKKGYIGMADIRRLLEEVRR